MSDAILHFAGELMSSWWIYLALWGFGALDGFFPAIPSETLGIGLALAVTLVVELVRHRLRKPQPQVEPDPELVDATE